jgi:hypothetical protein
MRRRQFNALLGGTAVAALSAPHQALAQRALRKAALRPDTLVSIEPYKPSAFQENGAGPMVRTAEKPSRGMRGQSIPFCDIGGRCVRSS